jgi:arsenate reductase
MTDPSPERPRVRKVLFLCTGNSARSILAEALLNRMGKGRFRAFSAGSFPKGEVHPEALRLLTRLGFDTDGLRSKSWDEFAAEGAPPLDFILTVCDDAAGETCPIWPGHPMSAHWGIEDPARVEGEGQPQAFERAFAFLRNRISLFLALPIESLDRMSLHARIGEIGRSEGATQTASEAAR